MNFVVYHGTEEIKYVNTEINDIRELKEKLVDTVKDQDFWLEQSGEKIIEGTDLSAITGCLKICYLKNYCDLLDCKLRKCKVSGNCRFCFFGYCAKHKMPEEHICPNFYRCKREANQKNATQLENGKIEQSKI